MKKRMILASVAVLAIAAAAVAVTWNTVTLVTGAVVQTGDMTMTETAEGAYIMRERISIRSDRDGTLAQINVEPGTELAMGGSVAVFSDSIIQKEIDAVQRAIENLDANKEEAVSAAAQYADRAALALEAAALNARGVKGLAQSIGVEYAVFNSAIRDYMLANANAAVSVEVVSSSGGGQDSAAEKNELNAWLLQLQEELKGLELNSSAAGTVLNVVAAAGADVKEGDLIAVVGDPHGGLVAAEMDVGLGEDVTLKAGDRTWKGHVVDSSGKLVYIEPEAGFEATENIVVSRTLKALEDVCILPAACVAEDEQGSYVMICTDGALEKRPVTVAMEQGESVALTAGVGIGETAVLFPDRYEDGMKVKLEE